MSKVLTQTGLNRAMYIMLRKLGGKIVIRDSDIDSPDKEDAMLIQYHPSDHVFVLSLHKAKDENNIIIPSMN